MPSVEFSDSYRIQSFGYPTNYVRIDYTEVEYDIASNKTKVRLDGVYIKYTGATASSRCFGTLKFNGTTMLSMDGSPYQLNVSESYTLVPGTNNGATVWIQHNDVGAATLTIALSGGTRNDDNDDVFGALYYYGSGYPAIGVRTPASKNVALTTHPRASTIASCPSSATTQQTITVSVSRKTSAAYHIATVSIYGTTVHTSEAFAVSCNFTAQRDWFSIYPRATTIQATVSVQTYTDWRCTSAVGSPAIAYVQINADAGMKPKVSAGWATISAYNTGTPVSSAGITGFVKGYSKAKVTFDSSKVDMSSAPGAWSETYSVTCQGVTDSADPHLTPVLASTSVSVVCTVTDTRGRSASQTFTISVMDYAKPALSEIAIFRCDTSGAASEDGTKYSAKATLTYSSLNGQNTATLVCAVAAAGGSYGPAEALTSGQARTSTANLSADCSYTVRITATDALGNTAIYYRSLSTRKWAMKFRPDGQGVAFGKAAEFDKTFEIADDWNVKFGTPLPITSGGIGANNIAAARTNLQAAQMIVPSDLAGYGLPVSGTHVSALAYNFTFAQLFDAVPDYSRVVIPWIQSQNTTTYGALAAELPAATGDFGMLVLDKGLYVGEFRFLLYYPSEVWYGSYSTVNSRGFNGWCSDRRTLLWINPTPSTLAAGAQNFSMSGYSQIEIECRRTGDASGTYFVRSGIGTSSSPVIIDLTTIHLETGNSNLNAITLMTRTADVYSTGIVFSSGQMIYNGELYKNWDSRAVPYRVWGIR